MIMTIYTPLELAALAPWGQRADDSQPLRQSEKAVSLFCESPSLSVHLRLNISLVHLFLQQCCNTKITAVASGRGCVWEGGHEDSRFLIEPKIAFRRRAFIMFRLTHDLFKGTGCSVGQAKKSLFFFSLNSITDKKIQKNKSWNTSGGGSCVHRFKDWLALQHSRGKQIQIWTCWHDHT